MDDYQIGLRFEDGFEGIVNGKPVLNKGISKDLLKPDFFIKVAIESEEA